MRKIRVFWHVLQHSLFPFDAYYKQVRKTHLSFSIKYFAFLVFSVVCISIVLKATLFASVFPAKTLQEFMVKAENTFPDSLVITMNEHGRLMTNMDKPYILFSPIESDPRPLLVVDPKAEEAKIHEYDTFALLTERTMYLNYDGSIAHYSYSVDRPFRLDKSGIEMISQNAQIFLKSYWTVLFVAVMGGILIGIPFVASTYLLTVLVASVFYWILAGWFFKHVRPSYSSFFKIGLHAATGPILIEALTFVLGLSPHVPFWFGWLTYIFFAGAIYESYFDKTHAPVVRV